MKKFNIDDAMVSAFELPAKGKRAYYYDEAVPGFGVAVTEKGTRTFIYYRKIAGKPKRITLGHFPETTVEAARSLARETAEKVAQGATFERELPQQVEEEPVASPPPGYSPIARPAPRMFAEATAEKRHYAIGMDGLAILACVLFIIFFGTGILYHWKSQQALQSVLSFAIDNHLNHREMAVRSSDPVEVKQVLEHAIPFEVDIPKIDPDLKLIGGRGYKIGLNPVAYTLWHSKSENVYSLLQFKLSDFNVSPESHAKVVDPDSADIGHTLCEALYWSRGDYGFLLIADRADVLKNISPVIPPPLNLPPRR